MGSVSVRVELVGVLHGLAGRGRFSVGLEEPPTLKNLIIELVGMFGKEFERALVDPELRDPRPNAIILVDGREMSLLQGLETRLNSGSNVTIIPVSHGG